MKHTWTDTDKLFMRTRYLDMDYKEMAKYFNVTPGAMSTELNKMGLCKSAKIEPKKGQPCSPPGINIMSQPVWVPPKSSCSRDGAMDAFNLPSRSGIETTYRDRSHP